MTIEELRAEMDAEKRRREHTEAALCAAAEALEVIYRGAAWPIHEAHEWLVKYDPIRLKKP